MAQKAKEKDVVFIMYSHDMSSKMCSLCKCPQTQFTFICSDLIVDYINVSVQIRLTSECFFKLDTLKPFNHLVCTFIVLPLVISPLESFVTFFTLVISNSFMNFFLMFC